MRHNGSAVVHGAHSLRFLGHVLNEHCGQVWAAPVLLGMVDEGRATTPSASPRNRSVRRANGRLHSRTSVVQLGKGFRQVLSMNQLVRGVLKTNLPAVRRAGWW